MINVVSPDQNNEHFPVMLNEVLAALDIQKDKHYLDCTFGCGGYSRAILEKEGNVTAIDRDKNITSYADTLKSNYKERFNFIHDEFINIGNLFNKNEFDGIVFDLGISSPQIDKAERGFSFMRHGPLDMRMGEQKLTAAIVVNTYSEEKIANILYQYGEEKKSRLIARAIVAQREKIAFTTTSQLAQIVNKVIPRKKQKIDPATRTFQGIRIYVNDELRQIEVALKSSLKLLKVGGKIIVVSFHSLEDRIVKNFIKEHSNDNNSNRYMPELQAKVQYLKAFNKRPITPLESELNKNSRSRSAKLRVAIKINELQK